MVDIETFATGPQAAITAIGAVIFDPFDEQPQVDEQDVFEVRIDLSKSRSPGVIDPATVDWWLKQNDAARLALIEPVGRVSLETGLQQFVDFVHAKVPGGTFGPGFLKKGTFWSNGPTFDERIMREAFARHGVLFPFHFRNSRCCRTMFDTATQLGWKPGKHETKGGLGLVAHKAVDDAIYQARGIVSMVTYLKGIAADVASTVDVNAID